VELW
jgi:hypothetical protein